MRWPFAKSVGCGNDFILFDHREGGLSLFPALIQRLCQRERGIGADGLILLERSTRADYRMRIFNCNGVEAEMCGNGLRCFVKWLVSLGLQRESYRVEVMEEILVARQRDNNVCIEMGSPRHVQWDIPLRFEGKFLRLHYLNTGVPHAVLLVKDIENINLLKLGRYIRNNSLWMPQGTNVTIAQKLNDQKVKIRTYERGIEGETLACGTGATAAALAVAHCFELSGPLIIETRSGEDLTIEFSFENQKFEHVTLIGPAELTFFGEIELKDSD